MPTEKMEPIASTRMDAECAHLDALTDDAPEPALWAALFQMLKSADVPADFLTERKDGPAQRRTLQV